MDERSKTVILCVIARLITVNFVSYDIGQSAAFAIIILILQSSVCERVNECVRDVRAGGHGKLFDPS